MLTKRVFVFFRNWYVVMIMFIFLKGLLFEKVVLTVV